MEWFVVNLFPGGFNFEECAESKAGDQLPRFVRWQKLHYRLVLVLDAETAYALAAVDVKYPHRYAVFAGDAREKVGEWFGVVIVLDNELALIVEVVFWLWQRVVLGHFRQKLISSILQVLDALST